MQEVRAHRTMRRQRWREAGGDRALAAQSQALPPRSAKLLAVLHSHGWPGQAADIRPVRDRQTAHAPSCPPCNPAGLPPARLGQTEPMASHSYLHLQQIRLQHGQRLAHTRCRPQKPRPEKALPHALPGASDPMWGPAPWPVPARQPASRHTSHPRACPAQPMRSDGVVCE